MENGNGKMLELVRRTYLSLGVNPVIRKVVRRDNTLDVHSPEASYLIGPGGSLVKLVTQELHCYINVIRC